MRRKFMETWSLGDITMSFIMCVRSVLQSDVWRYEGNSVGFKTLQNY